MNLLCRVFRKNSVENSNVLHIAVYFRCFTATSVLFKRPLSLKYRITKKLGIPEHPKKPPTPFMRYISDVRPLLEKSFENYRQFVSQAAQQWKSLDENQKQKYKDEYAIEHVIYKKKDEKYKNCLTNEQKLAIKNERIQYHEKKKRATEKRQLKYEMKNLGKPDKPPKPYVAFYLKKMKGSSFTKQDIQNEWNQMDDEQKEIYLAESFKSREMYIQKLEKWKKHMIFRHKSDESAE